VVTIVGWVYIYIYLEYPAKQNMGGHALEHHGSSLLMINRRRNGNSDSRWKDLLLSIGAHGVASICNNITDLSASEARPNSGDDANSFHSCATGIATNHHQSIRYKCLFFPSLPSLARARYTWGEGQGGRGIDPLSEVDVDEVDADGGGPDADLPFPGLPDLHLLPSQHLGAAQLMDPDGLGLHHGDGGGVAAVAAEPEC